MSKVTTRLERIEKRTRRAIPKIRFSWELIQALFEHRRPVGYSDEDLEEIDRVNCFDEKIFEELKRKRDDEQSKAANQ